MNLAHIFKNKELYYMLAHFTKVYADKKNDKWKDNREVTLLLRGLQFMYHSINSAIKRFGSTHAYMLKTVLTCLTKTIITSKRNLVTVSQKYNLDIITTYLLSYASHEFVTRQSHI